MTELMLYYILYIIYIVHKMDQENDDFQTTSMVNPRIGRITYLVTYSQAEMDRFPTRESFGTMLVKHFNSGSGKTKVEHWACSQELHRDGKIHYHV